MTEEHVGDEADALTSGLEMPREQMLELGRKALDLLVDRLENLPAEQAWDGEFRKVLEDHLAEDPPEGPNPASEVLDRLARDVLPFSARLDHPRFFGFIPTSPTWPGVVADFLAAGYLFNQCTWLVASGPSQVELVVIDWFRRWIGYPEGAGGLFTSGGSAASVDAFVAAREAAGHPERATVYMSDQSHSALPRAAVIVGVQRDHIRKIPSDSSFRLDMDALSRAVADDRAAGLNPIAVCANAGTSSTGSIDPLEELADFCEAEDLWLHVDAAYGGFAVVTERGRELLRGLERADSVGLDAHKWFFQPYEAGCLLVKDRETLSDAFHMPHDILQDTVWGADHPNFADIGLQLSRSARALKVWMSVQTFGLDAFRRAVESGMDLAARAHEYAGASPVLEPLSTPPSGSCASASIPAATSSMRQPWRASTGPCSPRCSGTIPPSCPPRCCTARSRSGCASSTTPPPGTTCARPLKRSNVSGERRSRRGAPLRVRPT